MDVLGTTELLQGNNDYDVQRIAKLCNDIADEDFATGRLEDKLRLIIALAVRANER